jgi:hypothetical protein
VASVIAQGKILNQVRRGFCRQQFLNIFRFLRCLAQVSILMGFCRFATTVRDQFQPLASDNFEVKHLQILKMFGGLIPHFLILLRAFEGQ